jgi:DNA-binding NtrC family response regulator
MTTAAHAFSLLLIDDQPDERFVVERILKVVTQAAVRLDHVLKCSAAMPLVAERRYDLVLLDNRLSDRISARVSVPLIKAANPAAPIAIISTDLSPAYLQDPATLGVDFVVDKADLVSFLKVQLARIEGDDQPLAKSA